jgi:hypothetical protein
MQEHSEIISLVPYSPVACCASSMFFLSFDRYQRSFDQGRSYQALRIAFRAIYVTRSERYIIVSW